MNNQTLKKQEAITMLRRIADDLEKQGEEDFILVISYATAKQRAATVLSKLPDYLTPSAVLGELDFLKCEVAGEMTLQTIREMLGDEDEDEQELADA